MTKFLISLFLVSSLASCSSLGKAAVGAILDSGPSVQANAQVGKENRQTISLGKIEEIKGDKNERVVEASSVGVVNVTSTDNKLILLLMLFGLIGWLLPSPSEMGRQILKWFKKDG